MGKEILLRPERCILCYACEVACAREHGGRGNIQVIRTASGMGVPILCRHCEEAPCVSVCTAGALERRDGSIYLMEEKCTGCELCLLACPFGAVMLDSEHKRAYKCDLCLHRQEGGREPACTLTCPSGALVYRCVADFASRRREVAARAWAAGWERRMGL